MLSVWQGKHVSGEHLKHEVDGDACVSWLVLIVVSPSRCVPLSWRKQDSSQTFAVVCLETCPSQLDSSASGELGGFERLRPPHGKGDSSSEEPSLRKGESSFDQPSS